MKNVQPRLYLIPKFLNVYVLWTVLMSTMADALVAKNLTSGTLKLSSANGALILLYTKMQVADAYVRQADHTCPMVFV